MKDATTRLASLCRPRLLIRAARFGLEDYNRSRDLKRVMGTNRAPNPSCAIDTLIEKEAHFEEIRKQGDATYNAARHIDVLVALMAEARLLPRSQSTV